MIKVITNSLGSGDWIHIKDGDHTIFEGHRVGIQDLVFLLGRFADAKLIQLTDEEMEERGRDMKQDWCFYWDNEKSELTLHNKTKEEAFDIAHHFGWCPRVWYRPSTWGNAFLVLGVDK